MTGLVTTIGKSIKVYVNTTNVERGRYVSVCVEIYLSVLIIGRVWWKDYWYKVEYKGLHRICAEFGCYGYLPRECTIEKQLHQSLDRTSMATKTSGKVHLQIESPSLQAINPSWVEVLSTAKEDSNVLVVVHGNRLLVSCKKTEILIRT